MKRSILRNTNWFQKLGLCVLILFVVIIIFLVVSQLRQGHPAYIDPKTVTLIPEVDAWIERQDNDDIVIHWQAEAESVQVYGGTKPAAIDTDSPLAQAEGQNQVLISSLDPDVRYYFQLVFKGSDLDGEQIIVAERSVPLEGAGNFRDLGGYRTMDGRRVRWGQVYRSGDLSTLTDRDLQYLTNMDLKLIIDLRYAEDIAGAPDRLPASSGLRYQNWPLFSQQEAPVTRRDFLFGRDRLSEKQDQSNQTMVDDKTEVIAEIFRLFADSGNLPTVVHCSNGTARTGFVSALLLAALGVPEDTVVADYTLSNLNYDEFYAEAQEKVRILSVFGVTADDLQPMILSQPKTMQSVFDHIHQQYGSLETYLSETVGLDDETIARLRNNLLY